MYDIRLGTGTADDWSNATWNRGALRLFYDSNFAYGNGGTNNNGNVYRMDHFVPTNESASQWSMSLDYYGYDALNRITGVWENKAAHNLGETSTGLTQQYVYDRYGNRTVNNAVSNFPGVFNLPFNVDQTTNRLLAPNGTISYNAVGNQVNDGYSGAGARTYDANNKLVSAAGSGGTVSYSYNANGSRVTKTVGSTTTWYIYGLGGELVAEYPAQGAPSTPQIEYGYRNGELLIEGGCDAVRWRVTDHLGSTRMSVGTSGALASVKRTDYLPFGEELGAGVGARTTGQGYSQTDCWRQKFTGYEKDAETGLDYAQARMFSGAQGRFSGIDPLLSTGKPEDPQSWNRYSYGLNNPLFYVDPTGMFVFGTDLTPDQKQDIINAWVRLNQALNEHKEGSKAYNNIKRALTKLGRPGQANGVIVTIGETSRPDALADTDVNKIGQGKITITFNRDKFQRSSTDSLASTLGHEGAHAADASDLFSKSKSFNDFAEKFVRNDFQYQLESNAYFVNAAVSEALNPAARAVVRGEIPIPGRRAGLPATGFLWNPSWATLDRATIESNQNYAIDILLQTPRVGNYRAANGDRLNGYGLRRPRK